MGERTLKDIEYDHWLAGQEKTGGLRLEWYGAKGYADIDFLLDLVERLQPAPANRQQRRAAKSQRRRA